MIIESKVGEIESCKQQPKVLLGQIISPEIIKKAITPKNSHFYSKYTSIDETNIQEVPEEEDLSPRKGREYEF